MGISAAETGDSMLGDAPFAAHGGDASPDTTLLRTPSGRGQTARGTSKSRLKSSRNKSGGRSKSRSGRRHRSEVGPSSPSTNDAVVGAGGDSKKTDTEEPLPLLKAGAAIRADQRRAVVENLSSDLDASALALLTHRLSVTTDR